MQFRFLLALQLGMTVAQLSETMTAAEEAHWLALYRKSPWGTAAHDALNALQAQLIHNTNAPRGKGKELKDFLLFAEKRETPGDTPAQIRSNFESLIARQRK